MVMRTGKLSGLLVLASACAGTAQTTAEAPQPPAPAAREPHHASPAVASAPADPSDPAFCGGPSPHRTAPPSAKRTNNCPHPLVFTAGQQPQHLWLSTEGTFKIEERSYSPRFFVSLDISKGQPTLVLENAAYKYTTPISPDRPRVFRINNWQISLDTVVPGPETRHEAGTWSANGQIRVHAGLHIEPALPPSDAPQLATGACGDPSPARTTLPPGLGNHPAPGEPDFIGFGQKKKFGGVEVEYVARTREQQGVPPESRPTLALRDQAAPYPNLVELHTDNGGGFIRADRELLLATVKTPKNPAKIRRFPLSCGSSLTVPPPTAPTWLWLGTFGHTRALVGDPTSPALTLELKYGQLWATTANGSYSRFISPDSEQNAFSLDGYIIEVVDVEPSGNDRYVDGHWLSDRMISGVNVQLRITPSA